jgi:hypothetical protein
MNILSTSTVEKMPQRSTHRLLGPLEPPPVKLPRNAGGRSGARRLAKQVVPPALRQRLAGPQYSHGQWHDCNTWPHNLLCWQHNEPEYLFHVLNQCFEGRGHTRGEWWENSDLQGFQEEKQAKFTIQRLNRFVEHLQIVTTSNYSAIANSHTTVH